MRISDWSSDVCSSDLRITNCKCPRAGRLHCVVRTGILILWMGSAYQSASRCEQQSSPAGIRSSISSKRLSRSDFCFSKQLEGMKMGDSPTADRKSTRLTPVTNAPLVCRLLLEKKKEQQQTNTIFL